MDKASTSVRIRLNVMMFLQYMMFAVWWVALCALFRDDVKQISEPASAD